MEVRKNKTAALHNLGCKVNAYETEAMQQQLEAAGYEIVSFDEKADVYVINTCSVTNIADRKSRQMLHKAKKMNPDSIIVAAGCYVQTAKERTGMDVDADIILGNNRKQELASALEEYLAAQKKEVHQDLIDINHTKEYENLLITRSEEHTRAYVKVQDGCNQFCSYCVIPYARGRVRSRETEDVISELTTLAHNGVKEVVLTGIHLSSYGCDHGTNLSELIRRVHEIDGISRIRLGSLEPGIVTEEFAKEMSSLPKFCPHFHLSLQSGCNSVLKRMNRRYTAEEYAHRCEILRTWFDDPALTTDVIVGFPGETEEEFQETYDFLSKIRLYETHLFKYSKREGTKAASMPGQIQEKIKAQRSSILQELNRKHMQEFEARWLSKPVEVLFEEAVTVDGMSCYSGYTKEYLKVYIPADQDYENRILTGSLLRIPGSDGLFFQKALIN